MFAEMEPIGIPHCIILGERGLDTGTIEYKARTTKDNVEMALSEVIPFLKAQLG